MGTVLAAVAILSYAASAPAADLTDLLARAAIAIASKDYGRAIEIYSGALEQSLSDDQRRQVLFMRAETFDSAGQPARAEVDFTARIELSAEDYYDRGQFYLRRNRLDQALADLEAGARYAPNDARFSFGIGRSRAAKGQFAAAIEPYSRAIALDPRKAEYRLWRGEALVRSERYRDGVSDYDEAIALGGLVRYERRNLFSGRGYAYFKLGEFNAAVEDFDASLQLYPKNPSVLRLRGEAYEELGVVDQARADYERALGLQPDDAWLKDRLRLLAPG